MLGSIQKSFDKLLSMRDYVHFFLTQKIILTLKKSCFDFLTVFWNYLTFLENYPAKPGFSGSIELTGRVNLFCISGYAQFYPAKLTIPPSSKWKFWPFFESFLTLIENNRANVQLKCSIEKPGFGNFLYFTGHDMLLAEKYYGFGSSSLWTLTVFFRNFEFSQKLLCQMLDEKFNRKKRLPEFILQKRRLLVFCKRNVVFGKIPESQIRLSYLSLFVPFAFRKKISKSISSFSWAIGVLHRVIRKFWFTYFFSQYFSFFFFIFMIVLHRMIVL